MSKSCNKGTSIKIKPHTEIQKLTWYCTSSDITLHYIQEVKNHHTDFDNHNKWTWNLNQFKTPREVHTLNIITKSLAIFLLSPSRMCIYYLSINVSSENCGCERQTYSPNWAIKSSAIPNNPWKIDSVAKKNIAVTCWKLPCGQRVG
jgi:hypothetical protein